LEWVKRGNSAISILQHLKQFSEAPGNIADISTPTANETVKTATPAMKYFLEE